MGSFIRSWWKPALLALILTGLIYWLILEPVNLNFFDSRNSGGRSLEIWLRSDQPDLIQLFYDTGELNRWEDRHKVEQQLSAGGEQSLFFPLPPEHIYALRLDLGSKIGEKVVSGLRVTTGQGNTCSWLASDVLRFLPNFSSHVRDLTLMDDGLHIQTVGRDPYLFSEDISMETDCDRQYSRTSFNRLLQLLTIGLFFIATAWGFQLMVQREAAPSDLGIVVLGLFLLCLPVGGWISGVGNRVQTFENRSMRSLPEHPTNLEGWLSLPRQIGGYFDDHFAWRNELITGANQARSIWLNTSPLDLVLIGRDGWLYYAGDRSIRDYQGLERLTQGDFEAINANLARVQQNLDGQGIAFLVVAAPDKHTIYPEHLPVNIEKVKQDTRLDRILDYNRNHAQAPILDLRTAMLQRKQESVIYYRTDTHWNDLGAYYAYAEIMNALTARFPVLAPHPLSDYTLTRSEIAGFGLAPMISMQDFLTDEKVILEPHFDRRAKPADVAFRPEGVIVFAREIDDPSLPAAVIFRDSFATALVPLLEEHFRRVVFVWDTRVNFDLIAHEQPDIVIVEVVERKAASLSE